MLTLLGGRRRFCDGVTRRDALKAGAASLIGGFFGLPNLSRGDQARLDGLPSGRAKSVIMIFLHGGAATQDMFDLKPDAPSEIRGEFKPVATNVPGIQICEHLPRMSRWMHRAAIVRTVNHKAGCHNTLPAFTGYEVLVPDQASANPNHPPSMGSVCEYVKQTRTSGGRPDDLPAYVCVPNHLGWGEAGRRPGIYGGFLGQRFDPLSAECSPFTDPGADTKNRPHPPEIRGEPRVPHCVLEDGITLDRLNRRQALVQQLDAVLRRGDALRTFDNFDKTRERAFSLLTSTRLRAAFNLGGEDPRLRDRYGRSLFGSSVLAARKLVEAGVRFVNVFWDNYAPRLGVADYGWDTHEYNFITLRDHYLPWLDRTWSALIEDLESRGLLDETLVVVTSDFGRTPRVNNLAGRDHWTYCYSTLLAGAGIRGGTTYGESDAQAAFVKDRPVSTADLCATIYDCLGIDPHMLVYDRTSRPIPVAHGGEPIRDILT
jgi:hypothetical protein